MKIKQLATFAVAAIVLFAIFEFGNFIAADIGAHIGR